MDPYDELADDFEIHVARVVDDDPVAWRPVDDDLLPGRVTGRRAHMEPDSGLLLRPSVREREFWGRRLAPLRDFDDIVKD